MTCKHTTTNSKWQPYLSHCDVPEFRGKWKDSEELDFTQSRFQKLVISLNGVMSDVEVAGNTSQVCNLQMRRQNNSHFIYHMWHYKHPQSAKMWIPGSCQSSCHIWWDCSYPGHWLLYAPGPSCASPARGLNSGHHETHHTGWGYGACAHTSMCIPASSQHPITTNTKNLF